MSTRAAPSSSYSFTLEFTLEFTLQFTLERSDSRYAKAVLFRSIFSTFISGVLALVFAALAIAAFVDLNPTLPFTWRSVAALERALLIKIWPAFAQLDDFWRALIYVGLAAFFAALCAFVKPRLPPKLETLISVKTRPSE